MIIAPISAGAILTENVIATTYDPSNCTGSDRNTWANDTQLTFHHRENSTYNTSIFNTTIIGNIITNSNNHDRCFSVERIYEDVHFPMM